MFIKTPNLCFTWCGLLLLQCDLSQQNCVFWCHSNELHFVRFVIHTWAFWNLRQNRSKSAFDAKRWGVNKALGTGAAEPRHPCGSLHFLPQAMDGLLGWERRNKKPDWLQEWVDLRHCPLYRSFIHLSSNHGMFCILEIYSMCAMNGARGLKL